MGDPVSFVNDLLYGLDGIRHEYDPVKAHEYYLRTRELKGRDPAAQTVSATISSTSNATASNYLKPIEFDPNGPNSSNSAKSQTEVKFRRENVDKLNQMRETIDSLKKELEALVAAAKARSGVESKPKDGDDSDQKESKADRMTPQEKADAAQAAKEYREKHGQPEPSSEVERLSQQIDKLRDRIAKAKERIAKMDSKKAKKNSSTARITSTSNVKSGAYTTSFNGGNGAKLVSARLGK